MILARLGLLRMSQLAHGLIGNEAGSSLGGSLIASEGFLQVSQLVDVVEVLLSGWAVAAPA